MCDYKKRLPDKTGVFFCDRVLVFASHIRYNDRKLFQRERRKTVMKKIVFATGFFMYWLLLMIYRPEWYGVVPYKIMNL